MTWCFITQHLCHSRILITVWTSAICSSAVKSCVTVISFLVNVPVLSEQITSTQPVADRETDRHHIQHWLLTTTPTFSKQGSDCHLSHVRTDHIHTTYMHSETPRCKLVLLGSTRHCHRYRPVHLLLSIVNRSQQDTACTALRHQSSIATGLHTTHSNNQTDRYMTGVKSIATLTRHTRTHRQ